MMRVPFAGQARPQLSTTSSLDHVLAGWLTAPPGRALAHIDDGRYGTNAAIFVVLIVPATVCLAWWEHARSATPGKRLLRLTLRPQDGSGPLSFGRALLRNGLKVALPWELAHTGVFNIPTPQGYGVGIVCTVIAYALAIWYLVSLFSGRGMPVYDVAAKTTVGMAA